MGHYIKNKLNDSAAFRCLKSTCNETVLEVSVIALKADLTNKWSSNGCYILSYSKLEPTIFKIISGLSLKINEHHLQRKVVTCVTW